MASAERSAKRILVIDDNQIVSRSLLLLLKTEGFEPHVFTAGAPALAFSQDNRFEAALIDIHLPDLSGLEISRQLRQTHGSEMPIIIFSGDNSLETLRALPDAGATLFLSKPINASRLMQYLRETTGIPAPGSEPTAAP
jgi:two-component system sensor histidine kinase RpfC